MDTVAEQAQKRKELQRQQQEEQAAAAAEQAKKQAALKKLGDERKALELTYQIAVRDEKHAKTEMKELETTAKEHDEQLSQLKDRVSAVTAELSQLKLNSSLAEALVEESKNDTLQDRDLARTSFFLRVSLFSMERDGKKDAQLIIRFLHVNV